MTSSIHLPENRRTLLLAGGGALGLLILTLVLVMMARGGDDTTTKPETKVGGVDVGGLSREEVIRRLETELQPRAKAPIVVAVGDRQERILPERAGLTIDLGATADQVLAKGPVLKVFRGKEHQPVVRVDERKLRAAIGVVAKKFDAKGREGAVKFVGARPVAVPPKPGTTVSRGAAANAVSDAFLKTTDPVKLPVERTEPKVSAAEVERVMREVATPAVASPLTLAEKSKRFVMTPERIAGLLAFKANSAGKLELRVDNAELRTMVRARFGAGNTEPVSAQIRMVGSRPGVIPGRPGRIIDQPAVERQFFEKVRASTDRTVAVTRVNADPDLTTAEARALGVKEKLSTHTQVFPNSPYRIQNIGNAARRINNTLLKPGDIYSMNAAMGKRTKANGYAEGWFIEGGTLVLGYGGGVSTITTATWDAAFFAGMERIEQRGHSYFIERYKAGLEATVSGDVLDLKFRNDSPHAVLIQSYISGPSVTVTMWGTKRYDISAEPNPKTGTKFADVPGKRNVVPYPTKRFTPQEVTIDKKTGKMNCTRHGGVPGFDVDVTRVFRPAGGGSVIKRELLQTHYLPGLEVICPTKKQVLAAHRNP